MTISHRGIGKRDTIDLIDGQDPLITKIYKRGKYVPDKSKPMFPYDPNVKMLKKFIDKHFQDCELIDYDREHLLSDRQEAEFDF